MEARGINWIGHNCQYTRKSIVAEYGRQRPEKERIRPKSVPIRVGVGQRLGQAQIRRARRRRRVLIDSFAIRLNGCPSPVRIRHRPENLSDMAACRELLLRPHTATQVAQSAPQIAARPDLTRLADGKAQIVIRRTARGIHRLPTKVQQNRTRRPSQVALFYGVGP